MPKTELQAMFKQDEANLAALGPYREVAEWMAEMKPPFLHHCPTPISSPKEVRQLVASINTVIDRFEQLERVIGVHPSVRRF